MRVHYTFPGEDDDRGALIGVRCPIPGRLDAVGFTATVEGAPVSLSLLIRDAIGRPAEAAVEAREEDRGQLIALDPLAGFIEGRLEYPPIHFPIRLEGVVIRPQETGDGSGTLSLGPFEMRATAAATDCLTVSLSSPDLRGIPEIPDLARVLVARLSPIREVEVWARVANVGDEALDVSVLVSAERPMRRGQAIPMPRPVPISSLDITIPPGDEEVPSFRWLPPESGPWLIRAIAKGPDTMAEDALHFEASERLGIANP
jgi:hypothetical protein